MERKPIRLLSNARDVIDVISLQGPSTPAEIAEAIGVPRPSVYRLVDGLNVIGLTSAGRDGRVGLNLRWLHMADAAFSGMHEWSSAPALLDRLSESTLQTTFLTLPRGDEAVCIRWSPGRGIGVLILKPGRALPLYAGAAGRVMLAEHEELERYLSHAPFLALTPYTLIEADELRRDVDLTRGQGYAHSDQDATVGIGALGVPVRDAAGRLVACVSLAGVAEEIREERRSFLEALHRTASNLASDFVKVLASRAVETPGTASRVRPIERA